MITVCGGDKPLGVIAAGHAVSAQAGADALLAGGNAVDAALGALLASFTCEPMLTGLGAGGYILIAKPGEQPVLLDFFVNAPGLGRAEGRPVAPMDAVEVSFGHALQTFHGGPASCGVYGVPAGVALASERYGKLALSALTGPAAALARQGVALSEQQAYVVEIVGGLAGLTAESRELFAPSGRLLSTGEIFRAPEVGDALDVLGAEGADPFYRGELAMRVAGWMAERGGTITSADLAAYEVAVREPLAVSYRGRMLLTNPPPAAGGLLMAHTLMALDRLPAPIRGADLVAAMARTQGLRTGEFSASLCDERFAERFLRPPGEGAAARGPDGGESGSRVSTPASDELGSTTHVAALDRDGLACSMTTSNGSSSGVVVPGTGIHLNNMLGESDLNPAGFHRHEACSRLPSMMSPSVVIRDGAVELVLGSAGSSRIRSAILQTVLRVVDEGLEAQAAIDAPRLHFEDGTVFAEPGISLEGVEALGGVDGDRYAQVHFDARNLYFGGVQAVQRDRDGQFWGGGDPRRGGAAVVVGG